MVFFTMKKHHENQYDPRLNNDFTIKKGWWFNHQNSSSAKMVILQKNCDFDDLIK